LNSAESSGIAKLLPFIIRDVKQENGKDDPDMTNVVSILKDKTTALANSGVETEERELAMNDLEDLLEHWNRYVRSMPSATALSLSAFRNAMSMGKTHPDVQPTGLALSTVHTMKGLEKDIVFLIGMGQGTFPD
jgi:DNA helicase-2/ATP-dependent DNA helicase PcrA